MKKLSRTEFENLKVGDRIEYGRNGSGFNEYHLIGTIRKINTGLVATTIEIDIEKQLSNLPEHIGKGLGRWSYDDAWSFPMDKTYKDTTEKIKTKNQTELTFKIKRAVW